MINLENSKYSVISVIGTHAGESLKHIFVRKVGEIKTAGQTFWSYKSNLANPINVQKLGNEAGNLHTPPLCIFIEASSKNGSTPTLGNQIAMSYSTDKFEWNPIPRGIITTGSARTDYALVINELKMTDNVYVNLWNYSLFGHSGKAIKLILGNSTICAVKESSFGDPKRMISNIRKVLAVGKLVSPYGIWIKYL